MKMPIAASTMAEPHDSNAVNGSAPDRLMLSMKRDREPAQEMAGLKAIRTLPVLALSIWLCACAARNTYKDLSPRIPPLALTQGRIYIYRASLADQDPEASIRIDGMPIGTVKARSFFFLDREPGSYRLESGDETEQQLTLKLPAGQTRFVRLDAKVGLAGDYFVPTSVNEVDGAEEILPLDYGGPPLPKRKFNAPRAP